MSLVGNLQELGLGEILQIVSLSRKTGVLALHGNGREGSIVFRQGQVVRASSSMHQQSLGRLLIQKGVIDLAILRKALALQQEEGFCERLGVILIKRFDVANDAIEEVVRRQIENAVFSLFEWSEGEFEFDVRDHVETVDSIRMDPLQFMLDQGLNPQFLALEAARLLDEMHHAPAGPEHGPAGSGADDGEEFAFNLVNDAGLAGSGPLVIVDDDGPTLQVLAAGMRENGFDVLAMTGSEETLIKVDTLFRAGSRPTVLIDLIMPRMDGSGYLGGLELLELLHNNFKELPIIVMADFHHGNAEESLSGMGYPLIMKPRSAEVGEPEIIRKFLATLVSEIRKAQAGSPRKSTS